MLKINNPYDYWIEAHLEPTSPFLEPRSRLIRVPPRDLLSNPWQGRVYLGAIIVHVHSNHIKASMLHLHVLHDWKIIADTYGP